MGQELKVTVFDNSTIVDIIIERIILPFNDDAYNKIKEVLRVMAP